MEEESKPNFESIIERQVTFSLLPNKFPDVRVRVRGSGVGMGDSGEGSG
jgi:hypothetical protein